MTGGEAKMFEEAVRSHGPLVSRICSSYEARPALAEELVQDTFSALWRALLRFRGEASLRTFVARIAHNTCVSHVRRESRVTHADLEPETPSDLPGPEEEAGRSLARKRLLEAVRKLPIGQRQVVTLHLEGFSDPEVADALGLTPGNVAVRLTRARERLRRLMGVAA
ncbi:RNA polymerase sigma factor [Parvularcula maris]|uniref:Sigma-70 family RNA polymerase sigma factor n=1 Tax=Parvularcula maris TaxID=2965077 RepID=A0A9X2RIT7_9PROT|nr:sigma-70 family RNA polymerase sigma factor [Parvularcula maris]MCQ8184202.1 sigma-70 family RNA polymerase sigma factor [Parvularcula maris]